MLELLQIEWLKLRRYRTFWVLYLLMILAFPMLMSLAYYVQTRFPKEGRFLFDPAAFFQFPLVWQTAAWLGGFVIMLPALLLITLVTNEFAYRTHRQNIIDGWTRLQFLYAKWIVILLLTVTATLCVFFTALVYGLICGRELSVTSWTEQVQFAGYFFAGMLDYMVWAMLLALLLKRAGLTIGLYLLYAWIIEKIAGIVLNRVAFPAGHYLPLEISNRLVPNPFLKKFPGLAPDTTPASLYLLGTAVYIVIALWLSARLFSRADL
jgi:hypothetical protein